MLFGPDEQEDSFGDVTSKQVSITTAKAQQRLGSQLRAEPHKTNCCPYLAVLNMKHRHKKGWLFLVLNRVWHCDKPLIWGSMTYTGGSEVKAWREQLFCYAKGPVVCSFNAWPITAEAHDWGDWCALRDSLSITHLLPTSFHLHFRLVKNEIYTLLILQAGVRGKSDITGCCGLGLRKAMIRAKRMHSTRNCPLVWPMEENVIQSKKIQSSRHQHCTSARRNSQLSAKKRLWLWRWLTPNDRWLLMPQPSTSCCPLLKT